MTHDTLLVLAGAGAGAAIQTAAGAATKGSGRLVLRGWRWLFQRPEWTDPYPRPLWLYRFRHFWHSEPERRIGLRRWLNWKLLCRLRGHHFPRGLPNSEGYWHHADRWFGVCSRCSGMVMRGSQARLDEAERKGAPPTPIPRRLKPQKKRQ